MLPSEALLLLGLVLGLRPERALEIGIFKGGSLRILASAMHHLDRGIVIGLDPEPLIESQDRRLHGRARVIARPSPEGIEEAASQAGGPFDLVFVDGLHTRSQVESDLNGAWPHLAPGASIILHDAYHFGVAAAIDTTLANHPELVDCGYLSQTPTVDDARVPYNGLRMLRLTGGERQRRVDVVRREYERADLTPPADHPDLHDHDVWYCAAVRPCAACARTAPSP